MLYWGHAESQYIAVVTTVDSVEMANLIANELLTRKLAACVQGHEANSHYVWKGELKKDPEIIALPILYGSSEYLAWIDGATER